MTFDNYCGTEDVVISKVNVWYDGAIYPIYYNGERKMTIPAGERIVTDPLEFSFDGRDHIDVSFYLGEFTLMRSVVYTNGPLSEGTFANGDQTEVEVIDKMTSRKTQLFYFLSTASNGRMEDRCTVPSGDASCL